MTKQRRSAAEALDAPIKIQDFIAKGVPDKLEQTAAAANAPTTYDREEVETNAAQSDSQKTKKPTTDRRRGKITNRRRTPDNKLPEDVAMTYAKATIQKTVRFRPELISKLERWSRNQQANGQSPKSFQQIQNEALSLWIAKNVE